MCKSLCSRIGCISVIVIISGRANQRVSMNGRSHKDSFAVLAGQLEDRIAYETAGSLVQKAVFAASGSDVDLILAHHIVEDICIDTGRIDNYLGEDITIVCG